MGLFEVIEEAAPAHVVHNNVVFVVCLELKVPLHDKRAVQSIHQ